MLDTLWNSTVAWLGLGGLSVAGLAAVAWFFPPFRKLAIQIGLGVIAVMAIYAKGVRDQKLREKARNEEAVQKAREDYAEIDARPDDAGSASKRLRNGDF